jgi:hypothetical protein
MTDDEFDQLIGQSSLGTPGAKALRRRGAELTKHDLVKHANDGVFDTRQIDAEGRCVICGRLVRYEVTNVQS